MKISELQTGDLILLEGNPRTAVLVVSAEAEHDEMGYLWTVVSYLVAGSTIASTLKATLDRETLVKRRWFTAIVVLRDGKSLWERER